MKKYLTFGLIGFGFIACVSNNNIKIKNITLKYIKDTNKSKDTNKTSNEENCTKKIKIIDLDKISKQSSLKSSTEDKIKTIPISIYEYKDPNDEVALKGDILKKANKIKIGTNDEVALSGTKEYFIKTSELKDGDIISIKDKKNKPLIRIIIKTY
jgi:hypothetical protein